MEQMDVLSFMYQGLYLLITIICLWYVLTKHILPQVFKALIIRKELFNIHMHIVNKELNFIQLLKIIKMQQKKISLVFVNIVINLLNMLLIINKNFYVGYVIMQSLSELEVLQYYPKFIKRIIIFGEANMLEDENDDE